MREAEIEDGSVNPRRRGFRFCGSILSAARSGGPQFFRLPPIPHSALRLPPSVPPSPAPAHSDRGQITPSSGKYRQMTPKTVFAALADRIYPHRPASSRIYPLPGLHHSHPLAIQDNPSESRPIKPDRGSPLPAASKPGSRASIVNRNFKNPTKSPGAPLQAKLTETRNNPPFQHPATGLNYRPSLALCPVFTLRLTVAR